MIADPRRNAQDSIAHWTYGGAEATRNGRLGAGTPLPVDLRPVAISLCVAEDEICNAAGSAGQAPSETHRTFYEKPSSATSSAEQLHRILEQ
ncbi:hypothetical protein [Aeromicrobium sp. UC242_57]|uniref:hypothetical protein n=1 Tax=Aeromicrobium sp. UC242_57 TaxID=3374624 RepID=UPI0037A2C3A9